MNNPVKQAKSWPSDSQSFVPAPKKLSPVPPDPPADDLDGDDFSGAGAVPPNSPAHTAGPAGSLPPPAAPGWAEDENTEELPPPPSDGDDLAPVGSAPVQEPILQSADIPLFSPGAGFTDNTDFGVGGGTAFDSLGEPREEDGRLPDFPLECLPEAVVAIVAGASASLAVPTSLTGCCALGVISAAIGKGIAVRSLPDRVTRGNLYIGCVAKSGTGKSVAYHHIAGCLHDLEREHLEEWRSGTLPGLKAKCSVLEEQIKRVRKDVKKEGSLNLAATSALTALEKELADFRSTLREPSWICADATKEAQAALLKRSLNEVIALFSPDARGVWDVIGGRYHEGMTDEALLLSGYSGDPYKQDRKGSDPVNLKAPCVSTLLMVQPDKMQSIMGHRQLADSGLFPRFLICDTKAEPQEEPEDPVPISVKSAKLWRNLVTDLVDAYHAATDPQVIAPCLEARTLMREYHNSIVRRRIGGDLHDIDSYAARWAEQAWRLAVVLHACEHGKHAHETPLSAQTAQNAVALINWFSLHQLQMLHEGRCKNRQSKLERVMEALGGYDHGEATVSELRDHNGIAPEVTHEVSKLYPTQVGIKKSPQGKPGRPSTIAYLVSEAA